MKNYISTSIALLFIFSACKNAPNKETIAASSPPAKFKRIDVRAINSALNEWVNLNGSTQKGLEGEPITIVTSEACAELTEKYQSGKATFYDHFSLWFDTSLQTKDTPDKFYFDANGDDQEDVLVQPSLSPCNGGNYGSGNLQFLLINKNGEMPKLILLSSSIVDSVLHVRDNDPTLRRIPRVYLYKYENNLFYGSVSYIQEGTFIKFPDLTYDVEFKLIGNTLVSEKIVGFEKNPSSKWKESDNSAASFSSSANSESRNSTQQTSTVFNSSQDIFSYLQGKNFYSTDGTAKVSIGNAIKINNVETHFNLSFHVINSSTGMVKGESLTNPDGTITIYVYPREGYITSAGDKYYVR